MHRARRLLPDAAVIVLSAVLGLALSLWLTPMQNVSAVGQRIQVGVTGPSWAWSGPGELDLFGQRIPTTLQFAGPVRPRLRLTRISLGEQVSQFAASSPSAAARSLQNALVAGWKRFFLWQVVVVALCVIALAGAATGWLRRPPRRALAVVAIAVVVAEIVDVAAIMVTAYTAPGKLRTIRSLQALVGGAPSTSDVVPTRPAAASIRHVVVIGDSTAAGQGNPLVADPTADDRACHRSSEAFAAVLAAGADWSVTNLACGGATIPAGLLGEQQAGGRVQPAQVESDATAAADVIIVSIGANDVHWVDLLRLCAVSASCSNRAEQAFLQQQLSRFSRDYLDLVSQLQLLPRHPAVVVNLYYRPFDDEVSCLASVGMTTDKRAALDADLAALNDLLQQGAEAAGFQTARPDFAGHGVCAQHPYVQGLEAAAPFHPNGSGELAIALADERALRPS